MQEQPPSPDLNSRALAVLRIGVGALFLLFGRTDSTVYFSYLRRAKNLTPAGDESRNVGTVRNGQVP